MELSQPPRVQGDDCQVRVERAKGGLVDSASVEALLLMERQH